MTQKTDDIKRNAALWEYIPEGMFAFYHADVHFVHPVHLVHPGGFRSQAGTVNPKAGLYIMPL